MRCDFDNDALVCPRCGFKAGARDWKKRCRGPRAAGEPSLLAKAKSLGSAVKRWIAAGRPARSPERIAEIFDTVCRPCPHFKATGDGKGECDLCGCPLKRKKGLASKLSMATESCPADPPRWGND